MDRTVFAPTDKAFDVICRGRHRRRRDFRWFRYFRLGLGLGRCGRKNWRLICCKQDQAVSLPMCARITFSWICRAVPCMCRFDRNKMANCKTSQSVSRTKYCSSSIVATVLLSNTSNEDRDKWTACMLPKIVATKDVTSKLACNGMNESNNSCFSIM